MIGNNEMYVRPVKKLGQNFLISRSVAEAEAAHSYSMNVLEMGPGYGILTKELCKHAKMVVAVEKDKNLYALLKSEMESKKLKLLHMDFFEATPEQLMLPKIDIMIANVPYNLSSKTIEFLIRNRLEAVLCLQKEFVDHMLASEDTPGYTKLSVMSRLSFSMTKIMDVKRGNFRPVPRVDSAIIYLKPKAIEISQKALEIIGLLMQHKKRSVHKALIDSHFYLNFEKGELAEIGAGLKYKDERVFKLSPEQILEVAEQIAPALERE